MKLADEMRNICRRPQDRLYYDNLMDEIRREAREGGAYRITLLATIIYNNIAKRLIADGFRVFIHNYNKDNETQMTYIVWDYPSFEEQMNGSEEVKMDELKEGLL